MKVSLPSYRRAGTPIRTSIEEGSDKHHLTAKQWCCLYDAAAGRLLAATPHVKDLWSEAEDGAIFHSATVLRTLERRGLLEPFGKDRYVASILTQAALGLPVR